MNRALSFRFAHRYIFLKTIILCGHDSKLFNTRTYTYTYTHISLSISLAKESKVSACCSVTTTNEISEQWIRIYIYIYLIYVRRGTSSPFVSLVPTASMNIYYRTGESVKNSHRDYYTNECN